MEQPQLQPQPQPPQLPPPPASAALSLPLMLPPPQAEPPTVVDDAKSLQRKENERVDASPTTQRADGIRKGSTVLVRFQRSRATLTLERSSTSVMAGS